LLDRVSEKRGGALLASDRVATAVTAGVPKIRNQSQRAVIKTNHESLKKKKFKLKRDLNTLKAKRAGAVNVSDKKAASQNYQDAKKTGKLEVGAAKAELKYDKAVSRLKTKKVWKTTVVFNKTTGKIEKTKVLTEVIKPMDCEGGVVSRALKSGMQGIALAIHPWTLVKGEISRYENENAALSMVMKAERAVEHGIRRAHKLIKAEPHRRASQLQHKMDKANAKKLAHEKGGNLRQQHKTKKEYMKQAKKSRTAHAVKKQKRGIAKSISKKFEEIKKLLLPKNPVVLLALIKGGLIVMAVFMLVFMIALPFIGGGEDFAVGVLSSYLSEDSDITAAYNHMRGLVETEINSIELNNPGYDLYLYYYNGQPTTRQAILNSYAVDPYELTSFLSAWYFAYRASTDQDGEVQGGTFVYRPVRNPNRTAELRGKIQEFFDNLFIVTLISGTQTVRTNYPPGVWSGGQNLIQVDDILDLSSSGNANIWNEFPVKVISIEDLAVDSGWNREYTLEVLNRLDDVGYPISVTLDEDGEPVLDDNGNYIPLQVTVTASQLYMTNFYLSRDYEVLNISVTTGNVERYIRETYSGEEGALMWDMYMLYMETQGNRDYLFP
jgi:hypothetical protein